MTDPFSGLAKNVGGIPTITPQELGSQKKLCKIIDVRRPDEFTGELGHIESAKLCTLETALDQELNKFDKADVYVFVCRSGGRSGEATRMALAKGFKNVYNMQGGMLAWNSVGLPIER